MPTCQLANVSRSAGSPSSIGIPNLPVAATVLAIGLKKSVQVIILPSHSILNGDVQKE
jgi:hypothetical protein